MDETYRDGRAADEARPVSITTDLTRSATGSCLIATGNTRVICTASVVDGVPPFLKGKGTGWLTAEYAMLPASTNTRKSREFLKRDGRSMEIQRLIGRSLRQAVDLSLLGEKTVYIDCDVLEADGGTRTASITGAFVALCLAVDRCLKEGRLADSPVVRQVAAISAGIVDGECVLDLDYARDSRAQADVNIVMTRGADGGTGYAEVQGTGEGRPYTREELGTLLGLADKGIRALMDAQLSALGERAYVIGKKPSLVLASNNFGKLRELRQLLGDRFDVMSMREAGFTEDIEETGSTFRENALIKANAVMAATGRACLADDSGLVTDALMGRPGVYSARYSGVHGDDEANIVKLLQDMENVPDGERTARFCCCAALCRPGREPLTAEGVCEGRILREKEGSGGFGYDPVFYCTELGKSFGLADPEEKHSVSHRSRAIANLIAQI